MNHSFDGAERRKDLRYPKNYSLFFYLKDTPSKKLDATFIRDISKGGVRFTTAHSMLEGAHLVFEIGIPYIAPKKLIIEGLVVSSKQKAPTIHEVRAKFNPMDEETIQLFDMIEKKSKGS